MWWESTTVYWPDPSETCYSYYRWVFEVASLKLFLVISVVLFLLIPVPSTF